MLFWTILLEIFLLLHQYGIYAVLSQTCLSNPNELAWTQNGNSTYSGTIVFDACTFTKNGNGFPSGFTTRCHNGSIPSPTLRMKRNSIYYLTLINNLGLESSNNPTSNNVQKDANTTNIHTHGLHISSVWPSDDIFVHASPGETITYKFELPCDHSGGTAWYHPHHHGSTALQVLGGAAGLIIIKDNQIEEGLPNWYINMTEILLIIQFVELTKLDGFYDSSYDYLTKVDNDATDFYLVNGEYLPTICMTAGQWTKFRIQHVDIESNVEMTISGCELKLLSKDSVLIHGNDNSVPRNISSMFFGPSSRADVAVHCPSDGSSTTTTYELKAGNTVVSYIEVSGSLTSATTVLTKFNPIRPFYLQSLLDYKGTLNYWDVSVSGNAVNGINFAGYNDYQQNISADTVNEWTITGANNHPFHLHVYHMQVMCGGDKASDSNWQLDGDWIDALTANGKVRFRTDRYGGGITMHCHKLEHEDEGAMGVFYVDGGCDGYYNNSGSGVPQCDKTCNNNTTTYTTTGYIMTPSPTSVCIPNYDNTATIILWSSIGGSLFIIIIIIIIALFCLHKKGYILCVKCSKEQKCCIKWLGKDGSDKIKQEKELKEQGDMVPQKSRQGSQINSNINVNDNTTNTGDNTNNGKTIDANNAGHGTGDANGSLRDPDNEIQTGIQPAPDDGDAGDIQKTNTEMTTINAQDV